RVFICSFVHFFEKRNLKLFSVRAANRKNEKVKLYPLITLAKIEKMLHNTGVINNIMEDRMLEHNILRFAIDNDVIEVECIYNESEDIWYGNYPVFEETPRFTPNGRPWKNVFGTDCPHSDSEFGDCGGCSYFCREKPQDVIAVCFHDEMKKIEE
ncbi:MAG: hypothetical protein IJX08_00760, partial [Clostridia bacterium]|nr:hypothetical protein [Clostridia bacterium]